VDYLWFEHWAWSARGRTGDTIELLLSPKGVAVDPHYRPGKTLVVVAYEILYNPVTHPIGRATISVETGREATDVASYKRLDVEHPEAETIHVGGKPGTDGTFHTAVSNRPLFKYSTIVTVHTAYRRGDIDWTRIFGACGKTNLNALPYLGNAAAGTMMLTGAEIPKYFLLDSTSAIVPVSYRMLYREEGWDTKVSIQKYKRLVTADPVVATWDEDTGEPETYYPKDWGTPITLTSLARYSAHTRDVPIGDAFTVDAVTGDTATFSHLNGLLAWML